MAKLPDEVTDEIEALEAMFGEDFKRTGEVSVELLIAPPPESDGHIYGSARLQCCFPPEYPENAAPGIKIIAGAELSEAQVSQIQNVAETAAAEGSGSVVVFSVTEAVREWLQDNTKTMPPQAPATPEEEVDEEAEAFVNDIDSDDLDIEMIEALEKVLKSDGEKRERLKQIRKLAAKEQRAALRNLLKKLTPGQLEELVASSSDSEDEKASANKTARAPAVQLGPSQIECPQGHALTAYSARPPDYKKFDGDEYTCDVCGKDGRYKFGVYHCTKCFAQGGKQYDACPSCGGSASRGSGGYGSGGGGGKTQKPKKKTR
eukprot:TRINITY_DN68039_c0_g1_i1.p1 TRINITY_DN68039_c0_g1~~TRINITY_DN68039_c0_g1_i1.p1  ORF type:complete len:318 (-),score=65.11 TRINITY_DN68039_c0_g1_i1:384-1337(-)